MKKCSRCDLTKPLKEFNNDSRGEDGHTRKCRQCINQPNEKEVRDKALFMLRNSWNMGKL